ncbi:MAG: hypothetical protein JWO94_1081 [Verrucomicrobiaceae bacterium]|nr:hypothetical protein [Verrucomicrobiaceae bacterium]
MPEVYFTVQLPDGTRKDCYSPSTVVHKFFAEGDEMSVTDFVSRSRTALTAASERVRATHGFYCTSADAQISAIERFTQTQPADGKVRIINI